MGHPANPPALPPEADKPRLVVDYGGLQVFDAREHIQIRLKGMAPRGLGWCLKDAGFTPSPGGRIWNAPHTPKAIMEAQNIGSIFFSDQQEKP